MILRVGVYAFSVLAGRPCQVSIQVLIPVVNAVDSRVIFVYPIVYARFISRRN